MMNNMIRSFGHGEFVFWKTNVLSANDGSGNDLSPPKNLLLMILNSWQMLKNLTMIVIVIGTVKASVYVFYRNNIFSLNTCQYVRFHGLDLCYACFSLPLLLSMLCFSYCSQQYLGSCVLALTC